MKNFVRYAYVCIVLTIASPSWCAQGEDGVKKGIMIISSGNKQVDWSVELLCNGFSVTGPCVPAASSIRKMVNEVTVSFLPIAIVNLIVNYFPRPIEDDPSLTTSLWVLLERHIENALRDPSKLLSPAKLLKEAGKSFSETDTYLTIITPFLKDLQNLVDLGYVDHNPYAYTFQNEFDPECTSSGVDLADLQKEQIGYYLAIKNKPLRKIGSFALSELFSTPFKLVTPHVISYKTVIKRPPQLLLFLSDDSRYEEPYEASGLRRFGPYFILSSAIMTRYIRRTKVRDPHTALPLSQATRNKKEIFTYNEREGLFDGLRCGDENDGDISFQGHAMLYRYANKPQLSLQVRGLKPRKEVAGTKTSSCIIS